MAIMPTDSPLPSSSSRRAPTFTKASWAVLAFGLLVSFAVYGLAVHFRRPGDWLPGVGEGILSLVATAVVTFICSLTALLRRERRCWLVLPPLIAGLGTILYCAWNLLTRR